MSSSTVFHPIHLALTQNLSITLRKASLVESPSGLFCLPSHRKGSRLGGVFFVCSGYLNSASTTFAARTRPYWTISPCHILCCLMWIIKKKLKVEDSYLFIMAQKAQNYFLMNMWLFQILGSIKQRKTSKYNLLQFHSINDTCVI